MTPSMRSFVAALCCSIPLAQSAFAAPKAVRTMERTYWGVRMIGVDNNSIGEASFPSRSKIAAEIFRGGCDGQDFCMLRAVVTTTEPYRVMKVLSVKKLPDDREPEDVIKFVYGNWSPNGFNVDNDDLEKLYTPRLADIIRKARELGRIEESEVLDQPFYTGQDGNPINAKMTVTKMGDESAIVRTTYLVDVDSADVVQRVNFEMRKVDGGWRIDDARLPLGPRDEMALFSEFNSPAPPDTPSPSAPPVSATSTGPASTAPTPQAAPQPAPLAKPQSPELPPIWK